MLLNIGRFCLRGVLFCLCIFIRWEVLSTCYVLNVFVYYNKNVVSMITSTDQ